MAKKKETDASPAAPPGEEAFDLDFPVFDVGLGREEWARVYQALSRPFPSDAIQRTKKADTKKGYDTTGVGYQFVVNRLNEVVGIAGWFYDYKVLSSEKGTFGSGRPYHDITVELSLEIRFPMLTDSEKSIVSRRVCVGGHIGGTHADALKGAITNALKKTAAMFGVGKQAYEGTLDDDAEWAGDPADATPAASGTASRNAGSAGKAAESKGKSTVPEGKMKALMIKCKELGVEEREARLKYASVALGREIKTFGDLTDEEADKLLSLMRRAALESKRIGKGKEKEETGAPAGDDDIPF